MRGPQTWYKLSSRATARAPHPKIPVSIGLHWGVSAWDHTCCHENATDNQQLLVAAAEHTEQPQHDTSTTHDPKANGKTAHAHGHRVMTVHVERLRRPEHDDGEKVGTRDEGDDQC